MMVPSDDTREANGTDIAVDGARLEEWEAELAAGVTVVKLPRHGSKSEITLQLDHEHLRLQYVGKAGQERHLGLESIGDVLLGSAEEPFYPHPGFVDHAARWEVTAEDGPRLLTIFLNGTNRETLDLQAETPDAAAKIAEVLRRIRPKPEESTLF